MRKKIPIIVAGAVTGLCAVLLVLFGNPLNMGFCIACFLRDIAGALVCTVPPWSSTSGQKLSALFSVLFLPR